jgi:hypothetical protein
MSINYSLIAINARLTAVANTIDAGAGNGVMNIFDPTSVLLVSITLAKPSGTAAGGILSFSGLPIAGNTLANGPPVSANITDSNANIVISGLTVGNSTAFDVVIAPTPIAAGQLVALTFAQITGS